MKKAFVIALTICCALLYCCLLTSAQPVETYKVAILPFKINAAEDLTYLQEGILDMLTSRIAWEEKILVIEKELCRKAYERYNGNIKEETARKIGSELGADYVLFGSITIFGNSASLDAKIVDPKEKKPTVTVYDHSQGMDGIIPKINEFATNINDKIFGRAEIKVASRPSASQITQPQIAQPSIAEMNPELMIPKEELDSDFSIIEQERAKTALKGFIDTGEARKGNFWKSRTFTFQITGMDVGDVDKDGNNEIVFISDEGKIWIYRYLKGTIVLVKEIKGKSYNNLISVDVADINKNGIDEIFISNLKRDLLSSFVLEWNGKDFVSIAKDMKWYLRVIKRSQKEPVLVGQKKGLVEPFMRGIYHLKWTGSDYEEAGIITSLAKADIYGFAYGDVNGDGVDDFMVLGEDDRLRLIVKGGSEQWRSDEHFGGSLSYVHGASTGEEADWSSKVTEENRRYLQPRILLCDLDGDETPEVLVIQNRSTVSRIVRRYRYYGSGHVYSLSWDGLGLAENWKTRKISGYLPDFAIADMDNDGENELVVLVVTRIGASYIYKSRSTIISYDLKFQEIKPEGQKLIEKAS